MKGKERQGETETGKSSAFSGTGCSFITLAPWSQAIWGSARTRARARIARLPHFYVGHVAILESILGRKMQDKNANCLTNTKVFIPWSLPVFAGTNCVISCSAAWALAYFEMPRRLCSIKTQYFPKDKRHFWFSLEFATNMCILASCLGGKQNIRSHFSSAIWDLSRLNH